MKISVSRGRTINMGDFESERIDIGIVQVIPNDSVVLACYKDLLIEVEEILDAKSGEIKEISHRRC